MLIKISSASLLHNQNKITRSMNIIFYFNNHAEVNRKSKRIKVIIQYNENKSQVKVTPNYPTK